MSKFIVLILIIDNFFLKMKIIGIVLADWLIMFAFKSQYNQLSDHKEIKVTMSIYNNWLIPIIIGDIKDNKWLLFTVEY